MRLRGKRLQHIATEVVLLLDWVKNEVKNEVLHCLFVIVGCYQGNEATLIFRSPLHPLFHAQQ